MTPSIHPKEKHMDRRFRSIASTLALLAGVLAVSAVSATTAPAPLPVSDPALSPDGRHLALLLRDGESTDLLVLSMPELQPVRRVDHREGEFAERVRWLTPDVLDFRTVSAASGMGRDQLVPGSLLQVSDGRVSHRAIMPRMVLGRSRAEPGLVIQGDTTAYYGFVALYRIDPLDRRFISTNTGRLSGITRGERGYAQGPDRRDGEFVLDARDEPVWFIAREGERVDEDGPRTVFHREGGAWREVHGGAQEALPWVPHAVADDGRAWVSLPGAAGGVAWGLLDPATGVIEPRAEQRVHAPGTVAWSSDGQTLLAVRDDVDDVAWRMASPTHPEAVAFAELLGLFPDQALAVMGRSDDGAMTLFSASRAGEPVQVFVFDAAQSQVRFLFAMAEATTTGAAE